ncbi:translation elongation factor Ts [candidate division KSB1 bacterium]|nr:translation elongation factor Ts [Phycisphaerae bacterium]NIR51924.1 translation elongation factor Ts [candidate division KSB1 bacterium]NIS27276.1 translation elongation factor Ts [candidate division KSB1 bacterium]NIU28006.1 translation elongation factor Ts [candidate division KSB1 bacterium]NIU89870.1 translation elongation factor Ts [candidate division KSB1 bacterium]
MKITTKMVKDLRDATGAGVLDAKKALENANGDFDGAVDILREKGAARAAKRSDREAGEGVIELYSHPGNRLGVILELNCETDFVARGDEFQNLAHDLALHIAGLNPQYIEREDVPQEELDRELNVLKSQAAAEGKPPQIIEKMVEGRIKKFYEEVCLMEQKFVKDDKVTIKEKITEVIRKTGENIIVRRFARYELGESTE